MIQVSWLCKCKKIFLLFSRWRWFPRYTYSLVFFTLFITKSITTLLKLWCFQKSWKLVKLRSFVYKQTHIRRRRSKKATNIFKNRHIWNKNIRNANDNSVFVLFTYLFCSHFQNIFAGWLYKRGNDGLKLWKKRYFVLSEYCLSYYKSPHDEKASGSILLPSYRISPVSKEDGVPRKFAFKAEHHNMRTYFFAADSQSNMIQWMNALSLASILQSDKR